VTGPEPPEPPDLAAELTRMAAARAAKIRHRNRIRAGHRLARLIGVDRRNAGKLKRIRQQREEEAD
jgi:hypothetical protein